MKEIKNISDICGDYTSFYMRRILPIIVLLFPFGVFIFHESDEGDDDMIQG